VCVGFADKIFAVLKQQFLQRRKLKPIIDFFEFTNGNRPLYLGSFFVLNDNDDIQLSTFP